MEMRRKIWKTSTDINTKEKNGSSLVNPYYFSSLTVFHGLILGTLKKTWGALNNKYHKTLMIPHVKILIQLVWNSSWEWTILKRSVRDSNGWPIVKNHCLTGHIKHISWLQPAQVIPSHASVHSFLKICTVYPRKQKIKWLQEILIYQ